MTIPVPEELVERGAEALWLHSWRYTEATPAETMRAWREDLEDRDRDDWRATARAVLEAVYTTLEERSGVKCPGCHAWVQFGDGPYLAPVLTQTEKP